MIWLKEVDMADEKTPWNTTRPYDQTEPVPEPVDLEDQPETLGEAGAAAQPDRPAPHGRMPLFGT